MNIRIFVLMAFVLTPSFSPAHELEVGANGGRLVEASGLHVELSLKGNQIEVFLTDKNEKLISPAAYKGFAVLFIEGKQQRITLEPAGPDQFSGQLSGKASGRLKGVVQLSAPTGNVVAHFK